MTVYDIRPIQISMPSREPPAFVLYIHIYIYTHYVSTIHDWLAEVCCVLTGNSPAQLEFSWLAGGGERIFGQLLYGRIIWDIGRNE